MYSTTPLVSVIIPCFNSEKYIGAAIESVLNQTYKTFEIILINDGSTDSSEEKIKKIQTTDNRLKYFKHSNRGVSMSRNAGLRESSGEIIAFLDSDDAWEPENLKVKVTALMEDDSLEWIFSDLFLGNDELFKTEILKGGSTSDVLNSLLLRKGDVIHAPSGLIIKKRSLVSIAFSFDPKSTPSEDWDLCIQLAAAGFKCTRIETPLWTYRVLPNSLSRNIKNLENGNLHVLKKALKANLFSSFWYKQKCFSNSFLILAGCWWVNGQSKIRGFSFIIKSLCFYPLNIAKVLNKLSFNNLYQAKHSPLKPIQPTHSIQKISGREIWPAKEKLKVFLFHRVSPVKDLIWAPIEPDNFKKILAYINRTYEVVPLSKYLLGDYLPKTSKPLCSIDFDDGYKDFLIYALPLLKEYDFPSTMHIVTDCANQNLPPWTYILNHLLINTTKRLININSDTLPVTLSRPKWKDRYDRINYAQQLNIYLKSIPNYQRERIYAEILEQINDVSMPYGLMLTWDEINTLRNCNCEIGSHTKTHPMLSNELTFEEICFELQTSGHEIEKNTGTFPDIISYPFGGYNNLVTKASAFTGYKIGLTVNPYTYDGSGINLFEIPRISLYNESLLKTKLRANGTMAKLLEINSAIDRIVPFS